MNNFGRNIGPHVDAELAAAAAAQAQGQPAVAFTHLERAHVLGQASTRQHVRVHWCMFVWGLHQRSVRECLGQLFRIAGAATMTAIGLVPHGNTGGANVSPFKPMPVPADLDDRIQQARARQP